MKKLFIITILLGGIIACNSNSSSESSSSITDTVAASTTEVSDLSNNPDYQAGLEVISKSDCFTCHEIKERKVGPSFQEIAHKYSGAEAAIIDSLANKVIKGGFGVWGQVPMTPHPALTPEEAKATIKYVLLLKNS
jgi:cytochrome c